MLLLFVAVLLVAPFGIDRRKPGKLDRRPGRAYEVRALITRWTRADIHRDAVVDRTRHLARHHPLPDEPVKASLILCELRPDRVRCPANCRWSDRLVCLLRPLRLRLVHVWRRRDVLRAVDLPNIIQR